MAARRNVLMLTALVAILAGILGLAAAGIQYRRHAAIDWFELVLSVAFLALGAYWAAQARAAQR